MQQGLVHLYYGDGKGKTTAAVGLAVRMAGHGGRVLFCQFLKGRPTGELQSLQTLGVELLRTPAVLKFLYQMNQEEQATCRTQCCECLEKAASAAASGEYSLVVLDEVVDAQTLGLLPPDTLEALLAHRHPSCELVLTGHSAPEWLVQAADYISRVGAEKHPYNTGTPARQGVEF